MPPLLARMTVSLIADYAPGREPFKGKPSAFG